MSTTPPTNRTDPTPQGGVFGMIGNVIYAIRWTLVFMYVGLWIAMIAYVGRFYYELFHFLVHFTDRFPYVVLNPNDDNNYLLWVLGLIDITMIGNLVVMTSIGGYSTFISQFHDTKDMPEWLTKLDSNSLKIKIGMSLVGVSAIHLLQTFMENGTWDDVLKEVLIHFTFIGTTLAFTFNGWMLRKLGHH